MIGLDELRRHYDDDVECLRLVDAAARAPGFSSKRFDGLTPQQVSDRLDGLRDELDHAFVFTMFASGEAGLRTDYRLRIGMASTASAIFWRRLAFRLHLSRFLGGRLITLEDRLVNLRVRHGDEVPLREILDAWKQSGADAHLLGRFKQLIKHRDWLAHGRHFKDTSGVSPDPRSVDAIVTAVFAELAAHRPNFPLT